MCDTFVFSGHFFNRGEIITWSTGFGRLADQQKLPPLSLPEIEYVDNNAHDTEVKTW